MVNYHNCKNKIDSCDENKNEKNKKKFCQTDICLSMIKFLTLNILKFFDLYYQLKLFKFLKKKGYNKFDTFFDVGAHRGETIILFSKNFSIKKIYSFEPVKTNFDRLKKKLAKFKKRKT